MNHYTLLGMKDITPFFILCKLKEIITFFCTYISYLFPKWNLSKQQTEINYVLTLKLHGSNKWIFWIWKVIQTLLTRITVLGSKQITFKILELNSICKHNFDELVSFVQHPFQNLIIWKQGESTLRVSHFCSKKVMYNKYYTTQ